MHDVPKTEELKFQLFTDDIAIAYQNKNLKDGNVILTKDLELINNYFRELRRIQRRLISVRLNNRKFHLNNRQTKDKHEIDFDGIKVNHNFFAEYLSV